MADETVTDADAKVITKERHTLAFEAVAEVQMLGRHIRDLERELAGEKAVLLRSMGIRIDQLTMVLSAVLEGDETDDELQSIVYG